MNTSAVFLDRDGTLIHPRHYPSQPEEIIVYDGLGPGLRRLQGAGFRLVLITNQAGLARGYFTLDDLERMHDHLREELAALDVRLEAIYFCPHHVDGVLPELSIACGCRKPQPGMLRQAGADLQLDLSRSWFVGDILDDIQAGNRAGCRTILVDLGTERVPDAAERVPHFVARDTIHALDLVAWEAGLIEHAELEYLPPSWQSNDILGPTIEQPAGRSA